MVSECQLQRRRPKTYWIDELVMGYQDNPTEERFAAILAAMRPAIAAVACRLGLRDHQLIDEAFSDGWKALLVAVQHWDRSRGGFAAYGTLVIKREMLLGLRQRTQVNRTIWRRQHWVSRCCDQLHAELCRKPSDQELAERLGVTEQELAAIQNEPHKPSSLPGPEWAGRYGPADERFQLDESLTIGDVRRAMQDLAGRSRQVLERRFLDGWKLREIAAETGLSKQRVDQIIQEALQELRQKLEGGSCAA